MTRGSVRIGGGSLRGRRLPIGRGVRPTSARVREALFSIWASEVDSSRFLDLFAGSGAVGFEAAGRGASAVDLIERSRALTRELEATRRQLALDNVRVLCGELPGDLRRLTGHQSYSLVFADPPYAFDRFEELLAAIEPCVAAAARVAIEHRREGRLPDRLGRLVLDEGRSYGETALTLYRAEVGSADSAER